jgi:N-acetylglucosamine kinase-like BadF-type ATPase
VYIGIDGGGTKTAAVLIDREGVVRATHLSSGAYYLAIGIPTLRALLVDAIGALLQRASVAVADVDFAFFGLPAYGEDRVATAQMDELPAAVLRPGSFLCGNDMICGWAGSLACGDGINVVAGTGSIAYGERRGFGARSGGWGEMFSDEGSAYWIACRGLDLFARMSDGRAPRGPLYVLLKDRLALDQDHELCGHVYVTLGSDRARVAQLCPLVFEAAALGDSAAAGIVAHAADELALLVSSTRTRLGFSADEVVDVSHSGGVFDNAGDALRESFQLSLQSRGAYRLCEPLFPPAIGAALYAAARHRRPYSRDALARLSADRAKIAGALR